MGTAVTTRSRIGGFFHQLKVWFKSPKVKKSLTFLFFIVVAWILIDKGRELEWDQIYEALRKTSVTSLVIGVALALLSYSAYAVYDVIGQHLFKIKVSRFGAWAAAWISFACNLNLGAIIGSVAFRYRLYSRLGVQASDVTRILGTTVVSNWLGYCLLAGLLFIFGAIAIPGDWAVGRIGFRVTGVALVAVVAVYWYLCIVSDRTEIQIRRQVIYLPTPRIVVLQFLVSTVHWSLMAAVVYQFMPEDIGYFTVFAVLLVSGIAGAVSHIPGGLGVLEAVFVALLSGQADKNTLLAGILAYRCAYYLIPLSVALPAYLLFESTAKKMARQTDA